MRGGRAYEFMTVMIENRAFEQCQNERIGTLLALHLLLEVVAGRLTMR
jgi:hypothetical protein